MDNQYRIINQCLQLLKQSDLPAIKKLRIEIQLIQMKRLLLNYAIPSAAICGPCDEDLFERLFCQMSSICGGCCEADGLAKLMDSISGMLSVLGAEHASS